VKEAGAIERPPNVLLLITDQQRHPRHWPDDPGWLKQLMPNDAELARTGLTFRNAFCNTAMCSPSRATLLTGRYPAQHGVTLTLTTGDLRPDRTNAPAVFLTLGDILRRPGAPRARVLKQFLRGLLQLGPKSGNEPVLPKAIPNLARLLRGAGYEVAYKGKWHLTRPLEAEGWSRRDADSLENDYGFAGWDPPDAGENAKAEHFGGGNAGPLGEGWDEEYTRGSERWLSREELPEPFCLVVSLVNPHDVLGYPASYEAGGYSDADFRELGIELPPTVDEDLADKPTVHTLMQLGMTAYLGPLRGRRAQLDYVNFYAYLHRVVDEKIGRVLRLLGDPDDPRSLRSRTLIVRLSDHGEMGLAHGGMRQKMFNVYEETVNVPLVFSNPVLFPRAATTDALASLIDVVPTLVSVARAQGDDGLRGKDLTPILSACASADAERLERSGVDLRAVTDHGRPRQSVQDAVHFTYDDHQAATALQNVPGQPNRIRAVRDRSMKYAFYFDPDGRARPEYEMYDLERDPYEETNLVDRFTGEARDPDHRAARRRLGERLDHLMEQCGTTPDRAAVSSSATSG
jgi:arylsulfatase A-like enzyme